MYPIAFAVVPKEDKANWCWFLIQLKYALGGEEGEFGKYTFMSDRQKVWGFVVVLLYFFPHVGGKYTSSQLLLVLG